MKVLIKITLASGLLISSTAFAEEEILLNGKFFEVVEEAPIGLFVPDTNHVGVGANGGWVTADMAPLYTNDGFAINPSIGQAVNDPGRETGTWGIYAEYFYVVTTNILLGTELGYKDFGTFKNRATFDRDGGDDTLSSAFRNTNTYVVDALVTGTYVVNNGFNVFIKLGVARLSSKVNESLLSYSNPALMEIESDYRLIAYRPELDAGAGWIFPYVKLYAMYTRIGVTNNSVLTYSANDGILNPQTNPIINRFALGVALYV